MESKDYLFTTNEEIASFTPGETMQELTGYIDAIDGLKEVNTSHVWIYKCVINNNAGTRIRVVFWSQKALDYSRRLKINEVVCIKGATIVSAKFMNPNEKINPKEFHVQTDSIIEQLAEFSPVLSQAVLNYAETTIQRLLQVNGPISVKGYLKSHFDIIELGSSSSYANCVLADRCYRVCFQVKQFVETPAMGIGTCVRVNGEVDFSKTGAPYIKVTCMNNVVIMDDEPFMSKIALRKAILPPLPKFLSEEPIPDEIPKEFD